MAAQPEVRRLLGLSSARQQGDARDSRGARHVPVVGARVGAAHPVRPGRRQHDERPQCSSAASARWRCLPTGPIASPPARCRRRRRVRRASSATSSSRCGTGPIRRRICTTWSRPIAAIRRSTPTGLIYGALELSADYLPVLDPVRHTASQVPLTVRDPNTPPTSPKMPAPSPYWGSEVIWTSRNNVHNPMFDEQGRVWITSAVRPPENPAFCKEGSSHPSAKLFPIERAGRHLAMYDPKTKKLTHISTCFGTHHLMFAEDANNTLWTSGGGQVVGWLNRRCSRRPATRRSRRAGPRSSWTPTATASATRTSSPNQPLDPGQGQALRRRVLRRGAGARRIGLGHAARLPGRRHPARTRDRIRRRPRSPRSTSRRSTIPRTPRLLAARRRRRSQRRVLGGAGERPPGQLRSPQVQGSAERSEGHRPALSRGLDALSPSRCRR